MHSKNPVFARKDGAFKSAGYAAQAQGMSADQLRDMYTAPSYQGPQGAKGAMTIDDVVARTAMTLGTVILVAGATWYFTNPNGLYLIGAALVGLGIGFFISLKHVTNPAVILGYAAVEGIFVGQASELLDAYASRGLGSSGIVPQAVLGTLCAAAGMLALYKFRVIRVTGKFKRFVIGLTAGFFLLVMANLVLSLFGLNLGLSGLGGIGLIFAIIGVALACFNLLLDFDYVEQGIKSGAPEKDAWFAAFGLTVTMVWLYIELLRIFAILRGDD
ncbi:Bax inhibitor-1/YccA family protein [Tenggerimyces flavus]|uniref:Bax inhibitor-1/YccA family protein n=1 Tax=Tenggerimyces flavus TaxID=1708749 RepID=A0ABV7Y807_9ACTN|nr:Bax inhibitor-1/YccA family protein [Tenggerimyces flavus]MBM7785713.1 putative YccA/Bax inhibitor family protein [Tenggerimyces flavus]